MSPLTGLNATFARGMALPGAVGFASQSGALCTAVLDWSLREQVGFSAFISIGSMADVSWGDLIDYLGHDPHTRSILLYMETIGDARAFLSAAREVALNKPIIVIKPGRTEAAAKAAASHTGSLTGSDEGAGSGLPGQRRAARQQPLLASPERLVALDARVVLHGPEVTEKKLPTLAIRPYPVKYISAWRMKDGTDVLIRPIRPEGEPLNVKFHERLSDAPSTNGTRT